MIVITGAAGFIASFLAQELNKVGKNDLVLVDDFSIKDKENNHSIAFQSAKNNLKFDQARALASTFYPHSL